MTPPYFSEYAIALGFDALDGDLINVEDIVTWPPTAQPLPEGYVKEKTVDGRTQVNGKQEAAWEWRAMSFDDFAALETYYGQAVTIMTRDGVTSFGKYNAYVDKPQPSTDYQTAPGGVREFRLLLDVIGEAV